MKTKGLFLWGALLVTVLIISNTQNQLQTPDQTNGVNGPEGSKVKRLTESDFYSNVTMASEPAPFEYKASPVSVDELASAWSKKGLTLYLPTSIPEGYKLETIYAEKSGDNIGSLAIAVYSNSGDRKIASAELTIEIFPSQENTFTTSGGDVERIQGYDAYIDAAAPVGWKEYNEKYGETAILLNLDIEGLNYLYRGAPTLSVEEMKTLAASMKPVSP